MCFLPLWTSSDSWDTFSFSVCWQRPQKYQLEFPCTIGEQELQNLHRNSCLKAKSPGAIMKFLILWAPRWDECSNNSIYDAPVINGLSACLKTKPAPHCFTSLSKDSGERAFALTFCLVSELLFLKPTPPSKHSQVSLSSPFRRTPNSAYGVKYSLHSSTHPLRLTMTKQLKLILLSAFRALRVVIFVRVLDALISMCYLPLLWSSNCSCHWMQL